MNNGLSGIKNIIWALAIVIALLALLVGLIFTVATRSYGDAPDGTLVLSSGSQAIDSRGSGLDADPYSPIVGGGTLKELPSTQDGGLEYVFGMTYLCTSSFSGINDYTPRWAAAQTRSCGQTAEAASRPPRLPTPRYFSMTAHSSPRQRPQPFTSRSGLSSTSAQTGLAQRRRRASRRGTKSS